MKLFVASGGEDVIQGWGSLAIIRVFGWETRRQRKKLFGRVLMWQIGGWPGEILTKTLDRGSLIWTFDGIAVQC